jgi:hypothetical protein
MRQRAQRNLPGFERRGVPSPFRDQSVGRFMTRCGEEKHDILEKSKRKLVGVQEPQYSGPEKLLIVR